MRSMWRWSVPQQPPSTLICGRRRTMRAVLAAQLHGVAGVQVRRLVELGVAALRRVGADAADAAEPGALARKRGSEMRRVRTVDHVVGRRTLRRLVHLGDRLLQALSGGQASVRLQREGDRRRHAGGLGRARDADRLAGVGHGDGRHHVGLGAGEDADLPGMVGLRLVGAHDGARIVAVAARADAAAHHERCAALALELAAQLLHQVDRPRVGLSQRAR